MTSGLLTYADAVDYLDSFVSYEKSPPPKYCGDSYYNLDRFRALLAALGHPEQGLRCIHIAGTDGKGSTAAFLASLLQACGHRVALYTSPHLFDYTERIQVDGEAISRECFTRRLAGVASKLEQLAADAGGPAPFFSTVFELLTAVAFQHFHEEHVDFAVIETGLGGLLDATNVVDPLLSVLTPIDREHSALLGKTLRQIATQKAGIIKAGRPVFAARQRPAVADVIRETSLSRGSPLFSLPDYLRASHIHPAVNGFRFTLRPLRQPSPGQLVCPLLGRHQVDNLLLALLVAQYVLDGNPSSPSAPSKQLLANARERLPYVSWPGRAEVHHAGNAIWILDSAHSPQAARCLRRLLDELFPGRPVHHLLAVSREKDLPRFLKSLVRPGDRISCYQSSHARALDRRELFSSVSRLTTGISCNLGPDLTDWQSLAAVQGNLICASGSIFWIADLKQFLSRSTSSPAPRVPH